MNIAIRQAAVGAFLATALMLGASAGPERGAQSSVLPGRNIRVQEWVVDGQIASATMTSLAGAFQTCGAKAFGLALDAAVQIAVHLRQG